MKRVVSPVESLQLDYIWESRRVIHGLSARIRRVKVRIQENFSPINDELPDQVLPIRISNPTNSLNIICAESRTHIDGRPTHGFVEAIIAAWHLLRIVSQIRGCRLSPKQCLAMFLRCRAKYSNRYTTYIRPCRSMELDQNNVSSTDHDAVAEGARIAMSNSEGALTVCTLR